MTKLPKAGVIDTFGLSGIESASLQLDADDAHYQREAEKVFELYNNLIEAYNEVLHKIHERESQTRQVTIREIKEWGDEVCKEHGNVGRTAFGELIRIRRECSECWQSLGEGK